MRSDLIEHLENLAVPPVIDVLGKWVHLPNARTGTTSIDEGPLRDRRLLRNRDVNIWQTVWENLIVPNEGIVLFTFVRNPWDRICSAFHQCRDRAKNPDNKIDETWVFDEWVKRVLAVKGPGVNNHFAEQYPTAYLNKYRFGFVGRFEEMDTDWERLSRTIGVREDLPHKNASPHGSYIDHYDTECVQIVEELYKRDIEAFGYKFGEE